MDTVLNLPFIGHVNYWNHYLTSRTSNRYDPNRSWLWTRVASVYGTVRVSRYEFLPLRQKLIPPTQSCCV